jgi:hypothetical protein
LGASSWCRWRLRTRRASAPPGYGRLPGSRRSPPGCRGSHPPCHTVPGARRLGVSAARVAPPGGGSAAPEGRVTIGVQGSPLTRPHEMRLQGVLGEDGDDDGAQPDAESGVTATPPKVDSPATRLAATAASMRGSLVVRNPSGGASGSPRRTLPTLHARSGPLHGNGGLLGRARPSGTDRRTDRAVGKPSGPARHLVRGDPRRFGRRRAVPGDTGATTGNEGGEAVPES